MRTEQVLAAVVRIGQTGRVFTRLLIEAVKISSI
jgi:hypothetical protein